MMLCKYKQNKRRLSPKRDYCISIILSACSEQKELVFFLHSPEEAVKSTGKGGELSGQGSSATQALTCWYLETLRKATAGGSHRPSDHLQKNQPESTLPTA